MKDVTIGNKTIRQLEVKLFETRFKHKLKFHINGLQRELDKVLSVSMEDDSLNVFINDVAATLEQSIESLLHED